MQNLNPIKPPFYKLKKFYIPLVLFIALFVILISLAHRPLELVLWQEEYFEKEQAMLQEYNHIYWNKYFHSIDKQEFIDFRQTHNIESKYKELRKELLKYMYNFEFDFKIAKILNLERVYWHTLIVKGDMYQNAMAAIFIAFEHDFKQLDDKDVKEMLFVLDEYYNFALKINALNKNGYAALQALMNQTIKTSYFTTLWVLLGNKKSCSFINTDEIVSKISTLKENIAQFMYNTSDKELNEEIKRFFKQTFVQADEKLVVTFRETLKKDIKQREFEDDDNSIELIKKVRNNECVMKRVSLR